MDVRLSKSGKIVLTGVLFPLGLLLGVGNLARVFNLQRNLFSNGEPSPTSVAFSTFEAHESLTLTDDERQLDKRLQTQSSLGILEPASSLAFEPVIDILSIGSRTRTVYQRSQENTFGQNRHVRRFEKVTEEIDSDQTCHTNLTLPEIDKIKEFCSYQNADVPSQAARLVRQFLFEPEPKPGWMCAQKRPIDAIYKALTAPDRSLPDYLFIVDDDTFLNMENVVKILGEQFRPDLPHKLTGCRFVYPRSIHFDFPYGGFGSILSRPVLENLLRPVDCESDDGFSQLACTRLTQNLMGERAYFENGMSLLELLYRFTSANPFTDVDNWKNSGYCFHSDHTLGYFLGFYPVGVPEDELQANDPEGLRKKFAFKNLTPSMGECHFEKRQCNPRKATICHYTKPQHMQQLHRIQSRKHRQGAEGMPMPVPKNRPARRRRTST